MCCFKEDKGYFVVDGVMDEAGCNFSNSPLSDVNQQHLYTTQEYNVQLQSKDKSTDSVSFIPN